MSVDGARHASSHHPAWTRCAHWVAAVSILVLAFTGFVILMAHPRLYWGDVGNGLTPALIELPISPNYRHGGWASVTPFFDRTGSPVSASRTFPLFNENAWGRSLHFLTAWLLTLTGLAYLAAGVLTGHLRRRIVPAAGDLAPARLSEDVRRHVRFAVRRDAGSPYGTLQKIAYTFVIVFLLPLAGLTGVTMSPAVTTAFPFLLTLFGGMQSARTIHFGVWMALMGFLLVHVVMVVATGFRQHMRAMTIGDR
ncbi:Ni/Fe-hydrogenase, b-type cytochrome subunit [Luteitalea pratensis]|uniref:Ni/Fe-hydrogenase, b-type cytochrome subunit n=1 Tax=Luteitalea pratensis TaxID=1855912 RepID=A0A143PV00_LUTPR|nr:cytochrome b/b6 domain-containing protein [Luteitalea pratensis]AMY11993.1 Ni/Fe-hydrogenase, b-type cytochrome subunit [Luteitalea pratensis]